MKPKLYILPGWGERLTDKNYQELVKAVEDKYDVVSLKLSTRNRKYCLGGPELLSKIVIKIKKQIQPNTNDVILGFSVGALWAYLLAVDFNVNLVLCSISPILKDDLIAYPPKKVKDFFPKNQLAELKKMKYRLLATKRVTVVYGEKESKQLHIRSKKLTKRKGWKLLMVKGVGHEFTGDYLGKVINLLKHI